MCVKKTYLKDHELFHLFIDKLFNVTCTTIQRIAYSARDSMLKEDLPMEQICKFSIDLLLEITEIMDRVCEQIELQHSKFEILFKI